MMRHRDGEEWLDGFVENGPRRRPSRTRPVPEVPPTAPAVELGPDGVVTIAIHPCGHCGHLTMPPCPHCGRPTGKVEGRSREGGVRYHCCRFCKRRFKSVER